MSVRASFVLLLASPIALAQCSGPSASPIGPSSSAEPRFSVSSAVPQDLSGEMSGTRVVTPLAKELTSLAGDWKGDLTQFEQDGDVFKFKFALTLAALGGGAYQGTWDGLTLTLTPSGGPGLYTVTMPTGEMKNCDGTAVVYTGTATSDGKKLSINIGGINNHCRLDRLEIDLKIKP
jgi:hypothetical protein